MGFKRKVEQFVMIFPVKGTPGFTKEYGYNLELFQDRELELKVAGNIFFFDGRSVDFVNFSKTH